jgi:FkbM family methyltransferase
LTVKTNPVVIDVGCNVGEFSELVFNCNDRSIIHAFDLHENLSPILDKKFKKYHFNFSQIALSDYSGNGSIASVNKNDRKAHLSKKSNLKSIKVNKLDNLLKTFNIASLSSLE